MPNDRWYYVRDKRKIGPVSMTELSQLARTGRLAPSDKVLLEGTGQWVDAQSVAGLFAVAKLALPAPCPEPKPPGIGLWLRRHPVWVSIGGGLACGLLVLLLLSRLPSNSHADAEGRPAAAKSADPGKSIPVAADVAASFIRELNEVRRLSGLGPVSLDAELSQGCQAHAHYLFLNPGLSGANLRDEDSARSGYSANGKDAAPATLVFFKDPEQSLRTALADSEHSRLLLDPRLLTLGLGIVHADRNAWFTVLDVQRGPAGPVILFPGDGQQDVPISFSGGAELEDTPAGKQNAGFPISVILPPSRIVTGVQATLTHGGKAVPAYFFTPDKRPPRYNGAAKLIGLIPRKPLAYSANYRVDVSAQIDGKAWSRSWNFVTAADPDASGVLAAQAVAYVNQFRQKAGLPPVTLDADLSKACRKHVDYLVQNYDQPAVKGLGAHTEDAKLPGASEEGRHAGKASVITQGFHNSLASVDSWMATLYHRVPLLDPRLTRIGYSSGHGPRLGWVSVLDATTGRVPGTFQGAVIFPADGQRDVPLAFPAGGETPDPIPQNKTGRAGFPITVTFAAGKKLQGAAGSVENGQGQALPIWFSSPEKPANPHFVRNQGTTICMIPHEPLRPSAVYRARVQVKVDGVAWDKTWSFTTGPEGPSAASTAAAILQRINQVRSQAGVNKVELDDVSCARCLAHARYLVLNADLRVGKDFVYNDERPDLPGFTPEGRDLSRSGVHVYFKAPAPAMQVETMIAGLTARIWLLDPNTRRIGFGCALEAGRGWTCVLDLHAQRVPVK